MKLFLLPFLLSFGGSIIDRSQLLPDGRFIGYERMFVGNTKPRTPGNFYPGMQADNLRFSSDSSWFHQVIINIHQDSITISKQPIQIRNGKVVPDSIGGFYHYRGVVDRRMDSTLMIWTFLDSSRFLPRRFADSQPRYDISMYTNIRRDGNNLILEAGCVGTIVFSKID